MPSEHKSARLNLKETAAEEFKLYWLVFAFLALMFGAFADYRRLVLSEVGISYTHWGVALVQAAVIAKIILVGRAFRLGRGLEDHQPLIVTVLVKSILYGLLVAVFDITERVITGLFHHQSLQAIGHRIVAAGPTEILANALVVTVAFLPFFAFWETVRVVGAGRLSTLFFHRRAV